MHDSSITRISRAGPSLRRAVAAYMTGEWKRAGEFCDRAARHLPHPMHRSDLRSRYGVLFSLWSLQFRGEIAELGRRWPVVLKEAVERGDRHVVTNLNTMLMSTLRLAADDPEGPRPHCSRPSASGLCKDFISSTTSGSGRKSRSSSTAGMASAPGISSRQNTLRRSARSHLTQLQKIRIFLYERRARCALPPRPKSTDTGPLLRAAERDARRLDRERMPWSRHCRSRSRPASPRSAATGHGRDLVRRGGERTRGRGHESLRRLLAPPPGRDHRGRRGSSPDGTGRFVDEASRRSRTRPAWRMCSRRSAAERRRVRGVRRAAVPDLDQGGLRGFGFSSLRESLGRSRLEPMGIDVGPAVALGDEGHGRGRPGSRSGRYRRAGAVRR